MLQATRQSGGNPCVELFGPDGVRIGGVACGGSAARINVTLNQTGTHSILVEERGHNAVMDYVLDYQCNDTCPTCPLPLGHLDYCRDCGPCAPGQGDCDSDSECQSGLNCVQVPGTDVCCPHPRGHLDYCRDCGPCAAGQGDCDNDGECQSGLTCPQVPGTDTCQ